MKKLLALSLLVIGVFTLSGCDTLLDMTDPDDGNNPPVDVNNPDDYKPYEGCGDNGDYVIIEGVCYSMNDVVSDYIHINYQTQTTVVDLNNDLESMNNYVADLTGSTGLAVVDRATFNAQFPTPQNARPNSLNETETEEPEETDNIIVKLTEDGFFEQVSFSDDYGQSVQIEANPLALEVYGDFTVIIFEVSHGWDTSHLTFTDKVWDSFYSGGIYLLHNDTGKLFATKDVELFEETWTDYEHYNHQATVSVTLNEPIQYELMVPARNEKGEPLYDENGMEIMEAMIIDILDDQGNPIIFTEGPLVTETQEIPVVEYFEQEVLDEEGNPVLDEDGNPIFEILEEPVLDEDGNPKYDIVEVPVFDEDGNPLMEQVFDVQIDINFENQITRTAYRAETRDNPLTRIAEQFVQKVMEEYYNWDFYRISNYEINESNFTYNDSRLFFMSNEHDNDTNTSKRWIKKMYFDLEAQEIVIENYVDLNKANFENCAVFVDPETGLVVCDGWEDNLKIYSETFGLKVIPDSDSFQATILPNGGLYFTDHSNMNYVEELGYQTITLHKLNTDGTISSSPVELGEVTRTCTEWCDFHLYVEFMDSNRADSNFQHVPITLPFGSEEPSTGEVYQLNIDPFDSTIPECEDSNGCWYEKVVIIRDDLGNHLGTSKIGATYYPGDTPSFIAEYVISEDATINYRRDWSQVPTICENESGCSDNISLQDSTIGNGIYLNQNVLLDLDDAYINQMIVSESDSNVYDFTRTVTGEVCLTETGCNTSYNISYYIDGELFTEGETWTWVAYNENIPVEVEYHSSVDTVFTNISNVCEEQYCHEQVIINGNYYYKEYRYGDDITISNIDYAATDRTEYMEKTYIREACDDINGCWYNDVVYKVLSNEEVEYVFFDTYADFGERVPYKAFIQLDTIEFEYETQHVEDYVYCQEETCHNQVNLQLEIGQNIGHEWLGNITWYYNQGDKIIDNITLHETDLTNEVFDKTCTDENGCSVWTSNYSFFLEDGTEVTNQDQNNHYNFEVYFEYGDVMPTSNDFHVDFEIRNIEFNTYRLDPWVIQNNIHEMQELDENIYFLNKTSWDQSEFNYIVTFDETTGRYRLSLTNMTDIHELVKMGDSYIAINEDKTAIYQFTFNAELSDENMFYFDTVNLTDGFNLNGVTDLIVTHDGVIHFTGTDNFLNDITGSISEFGEVIIDTEYTEPVIIRVRPIN